tara:strand:+ start:2966 stop:3493 length:528 start_codon:yes stop_codon:yes gene_type:complete
MAEPYEYVKRDVGRGVARFAGELGKSFVGDLGIQKAAETLGNKVRERATTAAGAMGASAKVASRIGKLAPPGLALAAAVTPAIIEQLGKGGPSSAAEEIAVRQAGAMGAIDQKLQADLVRQEGYMRMNEQKFQQQLMLQQARADAMTPRNQPMSGAGLFDPLAVGQQIYGRTPQY